MFIVLLAVIIGFATILVFIGLPQPAPETFITTEPLPVESTEEALAETEITVRVSREGYSPNPIVIPHGTQAVLRVRSTDGLVHGFSVPALGIAERIEPGVVTEVRFDATRRGTFIVRSHIASHPGSGQMQGSLTVS